MNIRSWLLTGADSIEITAVSLTNASGPERQVWSKQIEKLYDGRQHAGAGFRRRKLIAR